MNLAIVCWQPLCDMTVVKELEGDMVEWADGCFSISCPPLQLILRASDRDERERWMRAIRSSAAVWQGGQKLAQNARQSGVPPPITLDLST